MACDDSSRLERIINKHHKAVGKTAKIENLRTKADCVGPAGNYITSTNSSFTDDYVLFEQDYDYKSSFKAAIYSFDEGYGLDTNSVSQGPLSPTIIAVLKAHEFHEVMMQPEKRYDEMRLLEDTVFFDQKCRQIRASDHLGLPVRLYFDKKNHLMAGFSQVNPYKKGEVISIHFSEWEKKDRIKVFKKLEIRQGKKDRYLFDYQEVSWNNPDFEKLNKP